MYLGYWKQNCEQTFDRLVLLYKFISQNSKITPALFQLSQQILPDYKDLTTL